MTGKVLTRPGGSRTSFNRDDAYIERIEAAVAVFRSKNLDPIRPVPEQMNEAAARGTGRVRNPVYHYVISWEKQSVTHREAHQAVATTVKALGAKGWQWVGALHGDTNHPHAHVIINRIHPETGKAWIPSHDYYKLSKICRRIEPPVRTPRLVDLPSPRAADYEIYTGQKSFQTWLRSEVVPVVSGKVLTNKSRSWDVLHRVLAERGVTYEASGMITDSTGSTEVSTTAASVSPFLTLESLTRSLGEYEPREGSVPIYSGGYGYLRENHEITTDRMLKPDVAPYYTAWIRERNEWQQSGRERTRNSRTEIKSEAQNRKKRVRADMEAARSKILESVPELATDLVNIIEDVASRRITEISAEQKQALESLRVARPHELFRKWLKERAVAGDSSASEIITAFRRGETMEHTRIQPTYGQTGMSAAALETYRTTVVEAAITWSRQDSEEMRKKAERTASRYSSIDEPTFDSMLSTAVSVGDVLLENMTPEERKTAQTIEDDILDEIASQKPGAQHEQSIIQQARAASILPYAVKLEKQGFDARQSCSLYAIASVNGVEMGEFGRNFELTKRHADYLENRAVFETNKIGKGDDRSYPLTSLVPEGKPFQPSWTDGIPTYDCDTIRENRTKTSASVTQSQDTVETNKPEEFTDKTEAEYDSQSQGYETEIGSEAGDIGPDDRSSKSADNTRTDKVTEEAYRDRYESYMSVLAGIGTGPLGQQIQREIHTKRTRELETERTIVMESLSKKDGLTASTTAADFAARRQDINRRNVMENNIVHAVTGALPPPTFREYLETLGEDAAEKIAVKIKKSESLASNLHLDYDPDVMRKVTHHSTSREILFEIDGRLKFYSDGQMIHLDDTRDEEANAAAMLVAAEQHGVPLRLEGNKKFKTRMLAQAVELGITISNPELQSAQKILVEKREKQQNKIGGNDDRAPFRKDLDKILSDTTITEETRLKKVDEITLRSVKATVKERLNVNLSDGTDGDIGSLREVFIIGRTGYSIIEVDGGRSVCVTMPADVTENLDFARSDRNNRVSIRKLDEQTDDLLIVVEEAHGITMEKLVSNGNETVNDGSENRRQTNDNKTKTRSGRKR